MKKGDQFPGRLSFSLHSIYSYGAALNVEVMVLPTSAKNWRN